jgi:EmrB/QacA subfamily drug resistance transporter
MNKSDKRTLAVLFLGVLMGALDISIVGPAIPSIENSINIDSRLLGWIFSIYVLFNLTGISLFARLSDIYGRRKIYILSIAVFAFGSIIVSVSQDFTFLLIGRAIQGFGASGIFPVASAVVGDIFPKEKRGRVLGLIGAVFGFAFIIGPIIAGVLLKYFHWQALFLINIPIAVFLIVASLRYIPSGGVKIKGDFDWKGILSLAIMLAAFTYGINNFQNNDFLHSLLSLKVFPFLAAFLLLLPLTIYLEKNADNPILKIEFFRNPQIVIAGFIAIATGIMQSSFVFIPNYAVNSFGISASTASFMLVPLVLATAIGSPVFGRLIDALGSKIVIIIGLVLATAGFYLLHMAVQQKILFYTAGALIGLGLSVLSGSSLRYIMLNETSQLDRAVTQGMLTIFISLGQLTGAALIGVIIASSSGVIGFKHVFLYQSILLFMVIFLSFRLKSKKEEMNNIIP